MIMTSCLSARVVGLVIGISIGGAAVAAEPPATQPAIPAAGNAPGNVTTFQNVKVQGALDLENGVPIRWKKPDGSGYVNILTFDKNGTLQLCHDPYYFQQPH